MMSDEQVAAVVNYMRTHFGNATRRGVSADDVKARSAQIGHQRTHGGETEHDALRWPRCWATLLLGRTRAARAEIVRYPNPDSTFPIAQAVRSRRGTTINYVSGQVPPVVDKEADPEPAGLRRHQDADRRRAQQDQGDPEGHGLAMGDVVKMQVFLVHDARRADGFQSLHGRLHAVLRRRAAEPPGALRRRRPALANPGLLVEIEVVAAKDAEIAWRAEMGGSRILPNMRAVWFQPWRGLASC